MKRLIKNSCIILELSLLLFVGCATHRDRPFPLFAAKKGEVIVVGKVEDVYPTEMHFWETGAAGHTNSGARVQEIDLKYSIRSGSRPWSDQTEMSVSPQVANIVGRMLHCPSCHAGDGARTGP